MARRKERAESDEPLGWLCQQEECAFLRSKEGGGDNGHSRPRIYVRCSSSTKTSYMAIMCESEQCKAKVGELKEKEGESDNILKDAMRLWSAHEVSHRNLITFSLHKMHTSM